MRVGGTASLVAAMGCYQPEYEKDSGLDSAAPAPDTELPETTEACITALPVTGASDLLSDAPRQGDLDTRAADVVNACEAAGQPCRAADWISHDAATCIGPHQGVGPGIDDRVYAALRFDSELLLVVWVVENDRGEREGTSESWGEGVWLDASNGLVVNGPYEWRLSAE
jgi:hypothetical protein